ncbi:MAG: AtpZ/AtpI family protein [Candidatus Pacebacteria bacterium]|nr:AtpZ/AtpI family protein [Candidatus Paceibacterota bacterium]
MNNKNKDEKFKISYALSLVTQIGVTVSVITLAFLGLGYYTDKHFNTSPIFILIGAILAFISSMLAIYHLVLPVMDRDKKRNNNS